MSISDLRGYGTVQEIIKDRNASQMEKSINTYSGFIFYDNNGVPLELMCYQHGFNHMVGR